MDIKINKTNIKLYKGDITELSCDAITNAANSSLWMGAGVAGAIKKKGGKVIEDEAVKKGPIPIGSAVETDAGSLKVKYIIHAAVMGQDLKTNEKYIRDATKSTLELVKNLKLSSVALPAFGTGVGGFSLTECAKIMIDEIKRFCEKDESISEIIFALFGDDAYNSFEGVLRNV